MLSPELTRPYGSRALYFPRHSARLHAMIASCGFTRETSTSYDWHGLRRGKQPFSLIQYTTGGWGKLRFESTTYTMTAGQAMLLYFPHDNRYWLPAESDGWEFVYAVLLGSEINRLWRDMVSRYGPSVELPPDSEPVKTLARAAGTCIDGEISSPFQASGMAYSLTMALAHELSGHDKGLAEDRPAPVARAIEFCRRHATELIGVDEIAEAAGLSRYHFTRVFTAAEGIPPGEYLRAVRVERAASLLRSSDLSVKEVAARCGFYDATYFCKVFRRAMGVSPRVFRSSGMY